MSSFLSRSGERNWEILGMATLSDVRWLRFSTLEGFRVVGWGLGLRVLVAGWGWPGREEFLDAFEPLLDAVETGVVAFHGEVLVDGVHRPVVVPGADVIPKQEMLSWEAARTAALREA